MTTSEILSLKSPDRIEGVRRAEKRNETLERRFHLADTAFDLAWDKRTASKKKASNRTDFNRRQLRKTRRSAAIHAAATALGASKEKLPQMRARDRNQMESVLLEERRRRVSKAVIAIQKAIEANQRIHEVESKIEELISPGKGHRGSLIFSIGWPELNRNRFEDWLYFLKRTGVFEESDLAAIRSQRETI